jgi:hypothetical protein
MLTYPNYSATVSGPTIELRVSFSEFLDYFCTNESDGTEKNGIECAAEDRELYKEKNFRMTHNLVVAAGQTLPMSVEVEIKPYIIRIESHRSQIPCDCTN